jgi:NADH pyrophosphatase NudC (nudix superfamily)
MHKVLEKKLFLQNKVYRVFLNKVIKNKSLTNNFLTLEVINKYKNIGGVCCLIIKNNQIGLMLIFNPIINKKYFSIIQGFLEKKETPINSIQREIEEETGLILDKSQINVLCSFYPFPSLIDTKMISYTTLVDKKTLYNKKLIRDEIGMNKIKFYKKERVLELMKNINHFDMISYVVLSYFFFQK